MCIRDRFEGVVTTTENEDGTTVAEVVTQGFGGEIETNVPFDADGRITAIAGRDAQETDGVGGVLTADGSDYINALIAGQDDLDLSLIHISGARGWAFFKPRPRTIWPATSCRRRAARAPACAGPR